MMRLWMWMGQTDNECMNKDAHNYMDAAQTRDNDEAFIRQVKTV